MRIAVALRSRRLLCGSPTWRKGSLVSLLPCVAAVHAAADMAKASVADSTPVSTPQKKSISSAKASQKSPAAKKSPARPAAPAPVTPTLLRKAARISEQLAELYGSPPVPLTHDSIFQLLVAVVLSAQTTDKKVNEVTPELFAKAPDAPALAALDVVSIQSIIAPIGLAPTKARNLSGMAKVCGEALTACCAALSSRAGPRATPAPRSCFWSGMVAKCRAHSKNWRRCPAWGTRRPAW